MKQPPWSYFNKYNLLLLFVIAIGTLDYKG